MFSVEFEATAAEIQANFEINHSTPRARRTRVLELSIAAVAIIAGIALLVAGPSAAGITLVIVGALIAVFVVGIRALAKAGTKLQGTPTTLTVTGDGLTITTQRGQRTTPWTAVRTVTENHLGWSWIAQPPVGFVPRRALTADQQATLAALIARHVRNDVRRAGTVDRLEAPTQADSASVASPPQAEPPVETATDRPA
jgi:hypothetical protein